MLKKKRASKSSQDECRVTVQIDAPITSHYFNV